jgi:hypothetical protein
VFIVFNFRQIKNIMVKQKRMRWARNEAQMGRTGIHVGFLLENQKE